MNCANCQQSEEEEDLIVIFKGCEHFACQDCLVNTVIKAKSRTVRCVYNLNKKKVICPGFLEEDDIKWMVPETIYDNYVQNTSKSCSPPSNSGELQPCNSKKLLTPAISTENQEDDDESDREDDDGCMTFEELKLTEEEYSGGWGQIVLQINEFSRQEKISFQNALKDFDNIPLWEPIRPYKCLICYEDDMKPINGAILKDCFHIFCKICLKEHISQSEDSEVRCPFADIDYQCHIKLKPNEVKMLVSEEEYLRHYETLSLEKASKSSKDVFHCRTPDCTGWCYFDSDSPGGIFECERCSARNCSSCKVIHPSSCAEYWHEIEEEENRQKQLAEDAQNRIVQRRNEEISEKMINDQLNQRNFMRCPRCNFPCYKFTGCAHVTCSSCKHQFNWTGNSSTSFT